MKEKTLQEVLEEMKFTPGPIDIFYAVFQAKPRDISRTKKAFIDKFGKAAYEKYIQPYTVHALAHIFLAPTTWQKYWFMNRLAEIMDERTGRGYIPPPEFVAVTLPEELDLIGCEDCGLEMERKYAIQSRGKLLCLQCFKVASLSKYGLLEES